ncbi:MAG: pyridoxal phosphate-dependent decarboxylase family protein [Micromonosporaceae bacterium]
MPEESPLDPSPARIREMGTAALEWMADYHAALRELPVAPRTSAEELKRALAEPLPRQGRDFGALMDTFREVIVPGSRHNGHPRFFGYVSAPGTAVASVADLLASALNANLPAWRSAPAPTELEHVAIDWIREGLGLPEGAGGLFMSGGSMANFSAIAAARHRHCGEAVAEAGAAAHPKPLRLYLSTEAHHSSHKAAGLLGIGRGNVREVPVDERFQMDVAALRRMIDEDVAAGADPFCVVASAGTVVTGAVDPLAEIAAITREYGLWLHVDACYGGFARLAPSAAPLFDGIAEADSVALDPHKWLYLPADCGCLIYREPALARQAFALDADYTRVIADEPAEAFAFWDYGPDLSRRFRALKVWMTLAYAGADGIAGAIESNLDAARYAAELIEASQEFELMAPVGLSIFCFRYHPPGFTGSDADLDTLNERIMLTLQRGGSSYLSNASIGGRFALRGCVLNYRTTRDDIEVMLADVRDAARLVYAT